MVKHVTAAWFHVRFVHACLNVLKLAQSDAVTENLLLIYSDLMWACGVFVPREVTDDRKQFLNM